MSVEPNEPTEQVLEAADAAELASNSSVETGESDQSFDPAAQNIENLDGQTSPEQAEAPLSPQFIALQQALEVAQKKVNEQQEDVLRERAEMHNLRKRTQKEIENARKFALESFVNALLPVVDSLERGLEAVPEEDESQQAAREGLELTLKMLIDVLVKQKVTTINPENQPFNPDQHQAMTMQASEAHPPNTVLSVMQKGFLLNGRVLRPALVCVSK